MFTHVHSIYGALGVMLFLIAMYLTLEHAGGASSIMQAVGQTTSSVFKTLQGR